MRTKNLWTASLLSLALLAGTATAGDGDGKTKKPAPYADKALLTEAEAAELGGLLDKALAWNRATCEAECAGACGEECMDKYAASELLVKRVMKSSNGVEVFGPLAVERFTSKATSEQARGRLLDLVSWMESEDAGELANTLYKKRSDSFTIDHLLAFAMRGNETFVKALSKQKSNVMAAAFLAFEDDDSGQRTLRTAVKKASYSPETIHETLAAAAALKALGDERAEKHVHQGLHDAVLAALDADDLETARRLALSAEYFHKKASQKGWVRLAWLGTEMDYHCKARSSDVETPDLVFELIESLTPRG